MSERPFPRGVLVALVAVVVAGAALFFIALRGSPGDADEAAWHCSDGVCVASASECRVLTSMMGGGECEPTNERVACYEDADGDSMCFLGLDDCVFTQAMDPLVDSPCRDEGNSASECLDGPDPDDCVGPVDELDECITAAGTSSFSCQWR